MKAQKSYVFFILACITLALSAWGLYGLLTFVDCPPVLAVIAVGGVDCVAIALGKHALRVAQDGDSALPWNAALVAWVALGAFAQYAHAVLVDWPAAVAVVMASFPVATVALFEGELRRRYRLAGRAAGRLAAPRATFDLMTWLLYRRVAMEATRLAVLDRSMDSDTALMIAQERIRQADAAADKRAQRPPLRRTYADVLGEGSGIERADTPPALPQRTPGAALPDNAGQPDTDNAGQLHVVRPPSGDRGGLSAAVRAAVALGVTDPDEVLAAVRKVYPEANRDTVLRTLRRAAGG